MAAACVFSFRSYLCTKISKCILSLYSAFYNDLFNIGELSSEFCWLRDSMLRIRGLICLCSICTIFLVGFRIEDVLPREDLVICLLLDLLE